MHEMLGLFGETAVAVIAADEHSKIVYQNERCRSLFGEAFGRSDYVGTDMSECHRPETTELMRAHYRQYAAREAAFHHHQVEGAGGVATVVDVPVFEDGVFRGVVEFIFEGPLS